MNFFRLLPISAAVWMALSGPAFAAASTSGVVIGLHGAKLANTLVCIDANLNARCDSGEVSTQTNANGEFNLAGHGALVAQAGKSVYRAAAENTTVVSALSTEILALMEGSNLDYMTARDRLAARLHVSGSQLEADFTQTSTGADLDSLMTENDELQNRLAEAVREAGSKGNLNKALSNRLNLDKIEHFVVIYLENRSFDNLFGKYPGANGLNTPQAKAIKQVDRDYTTTLTTLPPAWGGMLANGQKNTAGQAITQAQTTGVWPNAPFQVDATSDQFGYGLVTGNNITRDLYHRFFENAMQINGGQNNLYAAFSDAGGLSMGYFDGSKMQLWGLAKKYTLADNFYQAAYGGSFLNHQYLVCACAPAISADTVANNKASLNVLTTPVNGVPQLARNSSMSASAIGTNATNTSFKSGNIAPLDYFGAGDGYRAVNTMQPPFQPSGNAPVTSASGNQLLYANPSASTTLPAQTITTIADLLDSKQISWKWYSGGWSDAVNDRGNVYKSNSFGVADATHGDFQAHHQPFNYYANFDPVVHSTYRNSHLQDRADLLNDITQGTLPAVSFYKPIGNLNQHPGYTNVSNADDEVMTIITQLQNSPQWNNTLVLITYDEFGGQFDHAVPPKGDLIGPGTRIPALIISPFAKKGAVDHTQYDTGSALRFITHRYSLPPLDGLKKRDESLQSHGANIMGDLTNALAF